MHLLLNCFDVNETGQEQSRREHLKLLPEALMMS